MEKSPRKRAKISNTLYIEKNPDLAENLSVPVVLKSDGEAFQQLEVSDCTSQQLDTGDATPCDSKNSSEEEEDDNDDNNNDLLKDEVEIDARDPFVLHYETDIPDDLVENIEKKLTEKEVLTWPLLKTMCLTKYVKFIQPSTAPTDINSLYIKQELLSGIPGAQAVCQRVKKTPNKSKMLSPLQTELLNIICNYNDLLYTERSFMNGEEIRLTYCLHLLNHVLKTRSRVLHHNRKLSKNSSADYRDQGLARPKVLIVVPFKESALRVVNLFIKLLTSDKKMNVLNKKRFKIDFMSNEDTENTKSSNRPSDFDETFSGNIDDSFRLGIKVTRKSIRLYADFYSSDIIITSPLGLRTIIGAEGEKDRQYDFLAAIEILILDQVDIFLMQNWEHVLHMFQHLHLQPTQSRNIDFSRIRMWSLNGWSKHYRQTLLFSSISHPLITALMNRNCSNFAGRYVTFNPPEITALSQVLLQVPQVFHGFEPSCLESLPEDRLKFFLTKVLVHFKDPIMSHTLIYIPSYFDFVRLRNHFRKEEFSFTQICEYSKDGKVARARDMFFHGQKHFLLFTERFHFYHRYSIKGVRHVVFYELPTYPHLYSEIVNFLHPRWQPKQRAVENASVASLYSRYESPQLTAVVGQDRARTMITSHKKVHMFVTER